MTAEDNSIRFNSQKNIAIKEMREKKRSNKNARYNGVRHKCQRLQDSQPPTIEVEPKHQKNSFTLVELGPLHKNGLPSLSIITVTTHSKMRVIIHSKQDDE
jgi:NADPH-dependent 7-cyano-7-deazaguanine reductase QueF-like protein